MSITVLTAEELRAKGVTARQVAGMLARAERLCVWHLNRHRLRGTTEAEQIEWDAACARWDHLKATLDQLTA